MDDPNFGCKTESLYYVGFEQNFSCEELNCILHCDWGIHFKEVRHEMQETIGDLHRNGNLTRKLRLGINTLIQSRFPRVNLTFENLVPDTELHILTNCHNTTPM